jgi:hypothetical protein
MYHNIARLNAYAAKNYLANEMAISGIVASEAKNHCDSALMLRDALKFNDEQRTLSRQIVAALVVLGTFLLRAVSMSLYQVRLEASACSPVTAIR